MIGALFDWRVLLIAGGFAAWRLWPREKMAELAS